MSTQIPRNVSRAIVLKKYDIFMLAEHGGAIPSSNQDGFGLYHHDCRYLDGYEVRLSGTVPNSLVSSARGSAAKFELTNEKLQVHGHEIPEQTFGLILQRAIDSKELAVHDVFNVHNYDIDPHEVTISLCFHSSFEDIFEIRGLHPKRVGRADPPQWQDGVLVLSYKGADGINRRLEVHPEPKPHKTSDSGADFVLQLGPGERHDVKLSLRIVETKQRPTQPKRHATDARPVADATDSRYRDMLLQQGEVHSDNVLLNAVVRRSLLDLLVLRNTLDGYQYVSAGLPWYGALFGRDSIIASLQTLAYEPRIAEQTLRLLAKYQGAKTDHWRDEEPGKILHELRRGELANLNEIPQTPYYGSVDSTPLFLILVGEHANWTGNLNLFKELRSNVEHALNWIDNYGDKAKNGYLSYASQSKKGLGNQGWKDSGDSIMNSDGSLATPPIALVEVQGYVYRAKVLIADLYARVGEDTAAARLRKEAGDLKTRFNRDFWLDDKNFYAIALQKNSRPAAVISSNPGQALWTGIVDDDKATAVVQHLTAEDMFSGSGIRTLSTKERRANPIGYHLGTVWPHDNSIITAGLRRYGFDRDAVEVVAGIVEAARYFEHYRLPEVFAGFSRKEFATPVRYPVACHPQAWAAGSVPFFLTTLLGLAPEASDHRLRVVRPVLPKGVADLVLRRIKVGNASVDLHFRESTGGAVEVDVSNNTAQLRVEVEQQTRQKAA